MVVWVNMLFGQLFLSLCIPPTKELHKYWQVKSKFHSCTLCIMSLLSSFLMKSLIKLRSKTIGRYYYIRQFLYIMGTLELNHCIYQELTNSSGKDVVAVYRR